MAKKKSRRKKRAKPRFLLNLDSTQLAEVRQLVADSDGKIIVLVHPFYFNIDTDYRQGEAYHNSPLLVPGENRELRHYRKVERQRPAYEAALQTLLAGSTPKLCVVFEATGHEEATLLRIGAGSDGRIYIFVSTELTQGMPAGGGSYESVIERLEILGVKHIAVAGCYFGEVAFAHTPLGVWGRKDGCASYVEHILRSQGNFQSVEMLPDVAMWREST